MIESERLPDAADPRAGMAAGFIKRRRALVGIAGLGMLVYLALAIAADGEALRGALARLGWGGTLLILGFSLLNYGLRFVRWSLYLRRLGHRLPALRHLAIYVGGFAFTVSPAKSGEAVRSVYLRRHGVSYADSVAALFAERLLDLLTMAVLAGFIIADRPAYRPLLAGVAVAALLFVALVSWPGLAPALERLAARLGPRAGRLLRGVAALLGASRALLQLRLLLAGLAIGLVAWGGEGIGFWLILRGLDVAGDPALATGIYGLAVLGGGAAFFMPGGIGGLEVVMGSLLVAQGASLSVAVVATLLCRLATLWFAVVLGLIAIALLEAFPEHEPVETVR